MKGVAAAMAAQAPGFWFVSRAAAIVGYVLMWASTESGILISSKAVKELVPGPVLFTLHSVTAWLGLGFGALHGLALLGDRVVSFGLAGILVPFAAGYQPLLTGLGTLSLYTGLLVSLSFYVTKRIGHRTWRAIHTSAYLMFVGITVHSIGLGTDSSTPLMRMIYLLAGGSVLFLTLFRILMLDSASPAASKRVQARQGQDTTSTT
jgi:predicted ferric reductase